MPKAVKSKLRKSKLPLNHIKMITKCIPLRKPVTRRSTEYQTSFMLGRIPIENLSKLLTDRHYPLFVSFTSHSNGKSLKVQFGTLKCSGFLYTKTRITQKSRES